MIAPAQNPTTAAPSSGDFNGSSLRRYANWVVVMLWGICFFNYADRQAISSVFPVLSSEFHFTKTELGLIGSAFMWVYAAGSPLAGYASDRFARKPLILGGCITWSVVTAMTCRCSSLWQFVTVRACEGFGETFYFPASMSLVSDYHGPRTRSRAMAVHQSRVYIGSVAGGAIGGLLAERFGWRYGFYLFGGAGTLLGIVLCRFLREPIRGASETTVGPVPVQRMSLPATIRSVAIRPIALLLMAVFFWINFVAGYFLVWTPTFLVEKFHFHLATAGLSGAAYIQLASAAGAPIAGWLADRLARKFLRGRVLVQMIGLLCGSIFVFMVGWTGSVAVLFVAMAGFGLFKAFYDTGIFASLYDVVDVHARGTVAGLMNTCGWIGGALGAAMMGWYAQHGGGGTEMANMSVGISLGGLIYLICGILLFGVTRSRGPVVPGKPISSSYEAIVTRFQGIIPPMITPLKGRDQLDIAGLERLIEHILDGGVHGLFILGTTGEGPSLSYRLRRELIQMVCRQVGNRVPVLVGITDTSFVEGTNLATFAQESGAQAVVASAPYYFTTGQPELVEYVESLAQELELPLFLYNMPSHTQTTFEIATVERLMQIENIVGIKDSSANMVYLHRLLGLLDQRPEWRVFTGPEELLAESILLGAHGGVCGGANLFPELYVELYRVAKAAQLDRVGQLHKRVMQISESIYRVGRHGSAYLKGLKCAMSCAGICDDYVAEPFSKFNETDRALIKAHLDELNVGTSPTIGYVSFAR